MTQGAGTGLPRYGLHEPGRPAGQRTSFPAQSSVLDEEALLRCVVPLFDIARPGTCRFYCRGDADIYRVESEVSTCYLKVYRPEYARARVEAEARLVADLADRGVPVVRPVRRTAGGYAHTVHASEGPRSMLLFEPAPGGVVRSIDPDFCERLGAAVARLHDAADALTAEYSLPATDPGSIDALLPYAERLLTGEDYGFLRALAGRVRPALARLSVRPPAYGLCHGDLVLSNIRLDENREVVFFDFGGAGYCWRGYELAILHGAISRAAPDAARPCWDALLRGYAGERPLPDGLPAMLPHLRLARTIGWVSGNAATLPLRLGIQPFEQDAMARAVQQARGIAADLPDPPAPVPHAGNKDTAWDAAT